MRYDNLDIKFKMRSHNVIKKILIEYQNSKHPLILDVGCASGIVGQLLGWKKNIYGIDKDRFLLRKARNYCEKIFLIDLDEFNPQILGKKRFDFIVCADVLEHLKEGERVLRQLVIFLKKDGIMIISLPNIAQVFFRIMLLMGKWDYQKAGVMDETHLLFYTRKTGIKLIEQSGLKIIEIIPAGTVVSFLNILPTLLASQFIFVCKKRQNK